MKTRTWSIGWTDANGIERRETAGTTDQAEALAFLELRRGPWRSKARQALDEAAKEAGQ